MKSSFAVGTIAGLIAGFYTGTIQNYLLVALRIVDWQLPTDFLFILNRSITSLGYNAIFGAFFGLLTAIFFDRIPNNRIMKGLAIGLIYCLFSALYPVTSFWAFDNPIWAEVMLITSPIDKFIYGIIFAYLYRK